MPGKQRSRESLGRHVGMLLLSVAHDWECVYKFRDVVNAHIHMTKAAPQPSLHGILAGSNGGSIVLINNDMR